MSARDESHMSRRSSLHGTNRAISAGEASANEDEGRQRYRAPHRLRLASPLSQLIDCKMEARTRGPVILGRRPGQSGVKGFSVALCSDSNPLHAQAGVRLPDEFAPRRLKANGA
jgi:hypothetical protein